jgi:hypothetical protein
MRRKGDNGLEQVIDEEQAGVLLQILGGFIGSG